MHMNEQQGTEKTMSARDAAAVISGALEDVAKRRTSLRRALAISRLALSLVKAIQVADLEERVETIEQALKKRR